MIRSEQLKTQLDRIYHNLTAEAKNSQSYEARLEKAFLKMLKNTEVSLQREKTAIAFSENDCDQVEDFEAICQEQLAFTNDWFTARHIEHHRYALWRSEFVIPCEAGVLNGSEELLETVSEIFETLLTDAEIKTEHEELLEKVFHKMLSRAETSLFAGPFQLTPAITFVERFPAQRTHIEDFDVVYKHNSDWAEDWLADRGINVVRSEYDKHTQYHFYIPYKPAV